MRIGYRLVCAGAFLALAAAGMVGCGKANEASEDTTAAIARIGPERITEPQFAEIVEALIDDPEVAHKFLTADEDRIRRNSLLSNVIQGKGIKLLAEAEGLDKDAKVRLALEGAMASVYIEALIERRMPKGEPTEADLRAVYNEFAVTRKAQGTVVPPFAEATQFAEAKQLMLDLWRRKKQEETGETLLKEIKSKFPTIYADEYKPFE